MRNNKENIENNLVTPEEAIHFLRTTRFDRYKPNAQVWDSTVSHEVRALYFILRNNQIYDLNLLVKSIRDLEN